jgi:hypothetical protein
LVVLFLQGESVEAAQAPGQWPGTGDGWPWGIEGDSRDRPSGGFWQRDIRARRNDEGDEQQQTQIGEASANLNSHGFSHAAIKLQRLIDTSGPRLKQLLFNEEPSYTAASDTGTGGNQATNRQLDTRNRAINKDPALTLTIRVSNQEEVSSRSIEGAAVVHRSGNQAGLTDGILDLSQSTIPNLLIQSDQGFHGQVLSVNKSSDLSHYSSNAALHNALVVRGAETGATWIQANQLLTLAAHSPGRLQVVIDADLTAMGASRLVDLGGDDVVDVGANQQLNFSDGALARQEQLSITIDTYGLVNSAVAMGPGNNWISINSSIGPWHLGLEGLMDLQASNQDWVLQIRARSIAMEHSQLDSGAGNDQVTITAALDPAIRTQLIPLIGNPRAQVELEQIAAIGSSLFMGAGDDNLKLDGDVLDSIIDLGTGTNQLHFSKGALDTIIVMGDGSFNQIDLGDQPNSITLKGGAWVTLNGGSTSDHIELSKASLSGLLDGGGGFDTISTTSNQDTGGSILTLEGPNYARLDELSILHIESIQLGAGDDQVKMSSEGWLTGQLSGGAGLDTLDFSADNSPVTVTIQPGSISQPGKPSMGAIAGFERILGGRGNDQFYIDMLSKTDTGSSGVEIWGGPGIDQFLWDSLQPSWSHGMDPSNGLPSLADLQLTNRAEGGIGLSDQIGWTTVNRGDPSLGWASVRFLTPSTIEGLGDSQLLPIAPIEQLLAGQASLGTHAVKQLAIGTTSTGAELLALGPQGENGVIAHLPGFFNGCCGSIQ